MQRPVNSPLFSPTAVDPAAPVRAADVPSDQLWRDAIRATRQAASAAAELRRAIQASRAGDPLGVPRPHGR